MSSTRRVDVPDGPGSPDSAAHPTSPTDGELVRAVLAGETEHFGLLVQRHQDALHRLAYGMVQDSDVAGDLVQDAFIRAFSSLRRCRNADRFRVWLMAVLRNRTLDYLKDRRRQDVPLAAAGAAAVDHAPDVLGTVAAQLELERALASLPPTLREAFLLRHIEDASYEDMAEMLDTTVAGVKMRVSRARDALRSALHPGAGRAGPSEGSA